MIFNLKLLHSVFLLVLITVSICFGVEKTSADNLFLSKNPPECPDLKLSKQAEQMLAAARLAAPLEVLCLLNSIGERRILMLLQICVFTCFKPVCF